MAVQVLSTITTRWINEEGRQADIGARFGYLGEECAAYALQTLGWIRVVRSGHFADIEFNADAVQFGAIEGLLGGVSFGDLDDLQLWTVTSQTKTRRDEMSGTDFDTLSRFVIKCLVGADRLVMQAEETIERAEAHIYISDTQLDPMFRDLISAWQEGKIADPSVLASIMDKWQDQSLKLMNRNSHGDYSMKRYSMGNARPWDALLRERLARRSLIVVPDRELASVVAEAAEETLARAEPSLERWRGPVISSSGVREFDWYRLSLPIETEGENPSLLVGCVLGRNIRGN